MCVHIHTGRDVYVLEHVCLYVSEEGTIKESRE